MTTKPQTLTDILTRCAGATVPCLGCNGYGTYPRLVGEGEIEQEPHDACNSTGLSYVLGDEVRLPCPGEDDEGRCRNGVYYTGVSDPRDGLQESFTCQNCKGRSWALNPDPYAWRRALRANGWQMMIDSRVWPADPYLGDTVQIRDRYFNLLVSVGYSDRLRDQLAEATAILRLLEGMPGVVLPTT